MILPLLLPTLFVTEYGVFYRWYVVVVCDWTLEVGRTKHVSRVVDHHLTACSAVLHVHTLQKVILYVHSTTLLYSTVQYYSWATVYVLLSTATRLSIFNFENT